MIAILQTFLCVFSAVIAYRTLGDKRKKWTIIFALVGTIALGVVENFEKSPTEYLLISESRKFVQTIAVVPGNMNDDFEWSTESICSHTKGLRQQVNRTQRFVDGLNNHVTSKRDLKSIESFRAKLTPVYEITSKLEKNPELYVSKQDELIVLLNGYNTDILVLADSFDSHLGLTGIRFRSLLAAFTGASKGGSQKKVESETK